MNKYKSNNDCISELVLNNLPIGILKFDSENNCSYVNQLIYSLFNLNDSYYNCTNTNFFNLFQESIHYDDKIKESNICKNFLSSLQTSESTSRIYNKRKDEYRWTIIKRIFLKRSNTSTLSYMYTLEDIHEIKKLEIQVKNQTSKVEESHKEKSSFLTNMSHEIRTPLNGIIGMLTLLEETDLSLNQQDYISMVKECSFNLMTIINDILDYSKLEANKITLDIKPMNIRECIESTNDIIISKIYEKSLDYHFTIDSQIPNYIYGDSNRIKQILLNLLSNSVKFTETGDIFINLYPVSYQEYNAHYKNKHPNEIPLHNASNSSSDIQSSSSDLQSSSSDLQITKQDHILYMRFDIIDTGCGIDKQDYHKLFKSFSQIETNITSKLHQGTGLGLVISKELTELMNGVLWLDKSSTDDGSTFSVIIPVTKCHDEPQQKHNEIPSELILQGINVLIVDDNLYNRMGLTGMVTKWGMKAFAFSDGEEALYYTNLYKFDLGLIDICMPKMSGLTFAIKLREQSGFNNKNIPLIALSSLGDKVTNNVNHFKTHLIKPIKETQLKKVCIDILQHTSSVSFNTTIQKNQNDIISDEYYKDQISIIVAEDSYVNQKVLVSFLNKLGYLNIQVVENGKQCLDSVLKNHYDIIFLDIRMPIMNGDIVLKKLLEYYARHPNKDKSYVIAVTAYSLKDDKDKYLNLGFNDYIPKPITIHQLRQSLNNFIKYSL
jgi:signal transduction histidine kinase/DNA-binding response OmpR family regulator